MAGSVWEWVSDCDYPTYDHGDGRQRTARPRERKAAQATRYEVAAGRAAPTICASRGEEGWVNEHFGDVGFRCARPVLGS